LKKKPKKRSKYYWKPNKSIPSEFDRKVEVKIESYENQVQITNADNPPAENEGTPVTDQDEIRGQEIE
jgi:hypothetical protein